MGNSELHCKLCGVAFAIGRIRQSHEPWQHAWANREHRNPGTKEHEEDKERNFVFQADCSKKAGCHNRDQNDMSRFSTQSAQVDLATTLSFYQQLRSKFVESSLTDGTAGEPFSLGRSVKPHDCDYKMKDTANDSDYIFESDQDDEPYEFQSQDDNLSDAEENPQAEIGLTDGKCSEESTERSSSSNRCDMYEAIRSASMSTYLASTDPGALLAPHDTKLEDRSGSASRGDDSQSTARYSHARMPFQVLNGREHIAGPRCKVSSGYSGYMIGADEMKGCNVMQCLFRKDSYWSPEPDDQEFELSGNYFLSGLCGWVTSRTWYAPQRYPVDRHNHGDHLRPDEILWDDSERYSTPMPFHPTCFEIFTRVSQLRLGSIDIEGLATWRRYNSSLWDHELPHHPAVQRAIKEDHWSHIRGDEFLAANPVLVPALPSVFDDAMERDPTFSIRDSAFKVSSQDIGLPTQHSQASSDPFNALPHEIIYQLLCKLPFKDIARLRLVSRAFRHLPISLFRHIIRTEMPFLWEVFDNTSPSLWAIHTASSFQNCKVRPLHLVGQLRDEQDRYRSIIKTEMPEVWESYKENQPWLNINPVLLAEEAERELRRLHQERVPLPRFDAKKMNWYKLYCGIVNRWDELKGLQNRKRIWEDMEEVVKLIEGYRKNNTIGG